VIHLINHFKLTDSTFVHLSAVVFDLEENNSRTSTMVSF